MARARFIRPEFFTDEKLSEVSFGARLLFAAIWVHSDLRGVFEYSAKQLRVQAFPHDEGMTVAQVLEWLSDLERLKMVFRFEAEGKSWGVVRNWLKYQHISKREQESGSKRPMPPELCITQCQAGAGMVPAQCQSASPSPSPTATPTPTPTSGGEPAAAATALRQVMTGVESESVRAAIEGGCLQAVLKAFKANTSGDRMTEWERDTDGLRLGIVAAIMHWQRSLGESIREASGFRRARKEFDAMPFSDQKHLACDMMISYGIDTARKESA